AYALTARLTPCSTLYRAIRCTAVAFTTAVTTAPGASRSSSYAGRVRIALSGNPQLSVTRTTAPSCCTPTIGPLQWLRALTPSRVDVSSITSSARMHTNTDFTSPSTCGARTVEDPTRTVASPSAFDATSPGTTVSTPTD